jgi:stress-induced morphogen
MTGPTKEGPNRKMRIQPLIEEKLGAALSPLHLEVHNESHMHSVPPGSETHFKVIVVSDRFEGRSLLDRQRMVFAALEGEMKQGVHALTMKALTPAQWEAAGGKVELQSPPCRGGSKAG